MGALPASTGRASAVQRKVEKAVGPGFEEGPATDWEHPAKERAVVDERVELAVFPARIDARGSHDLRDEPLVDLTAQPLLFAT